MNKQGYVVVTGAAGFIGSFLVGTLNSVGFENIVIVDDFSRDDKNRNLNALQFAEKVHRDNFFDWLKANGGSVTAIYHLGARTDTTEMDYAVHKRLNLDYSIEVWKLCCLFSIPLVYASSAATYGGGELGYKDDHELPYKLHPLNPYGVSKNEFDKWALRQVEQPPFWAGVKFFNVYGPNEYHKGRMASVIFHAFNTIRATGAIKLFRSHNPQYRDGEQIRDFIYVKDVVAICKWLMMHQPQPGLYNVGTGHARTFNDLARAVFTALGLPEQIQYIDTPIDIRDKYQYFTEADMSKLRSAGYEEDFYSLEEGVDEYVRHFLVPGAYYPVL